MTRRTTFSLAALAPLGVVGLLLLGAPAAFAGNDAEATTHGDSAATPQLVFEEHQPDFSVRQYQLGCLSQLTYLVISGGEAAVVDPQRDVDHYIRDAEANGARITAVILTHTNADFVAGHTELAKRVGAKIYISDKSGSKFTHVGMKDGAELTLGKATLTFWETPGHTLDSSTVLVSVPGASANPAYALTGDTVFIGSIGRPDLVGGEITPAMLGSMAFDSVQRIKKLPDATKVLPAHGAGSLCGAGLSDDTVSTIGVQKKDNPYFQFTARAPFVAKVVSGLPVAPQYFKHNVAMNREGPAVVDWTAEKPAPAAPAQVAAAVKKGAWVLDLRDAAEYAKGHVTGSINVAVRGRLDTWTGIVVPFGEELFLVGSDAEVEEATFRLRRIGYDRMAGYLVGGIDAWAKAGLEVRTSRLVDGATLAEQMRLGTEPIIVDVRTEHEFHDKRIGNYANIPLDQYKRLSRTFDTHKPVVLMCNSAYRSSMAVGLAEREGFTDIGSLEGGLHGWEEAGRAVVTATASAPAVASGASVSVGRTLVVPEVIEARALAVALMDAPQLYTVIDVRAAWQFAEYHLPGATNVAPDAVPAHLRGLPKASRVVLVDRDGSMAFAIAGAVLAELGDESPTVRVLSGGTAAYWSQVELEGAPDALPSGGAVEAPSAATPSAGTPPAPTPSPATPPTKPAQKKRNAGC